MVGLAGRVESGENLGVYVRTSWGLDEGEAATCLQENYECIYLGATYTLANTVS